MAGLRILTALLMWMLAGAPAMAAPHLIVDLKSGKVISRQQEFDRWYPASLTKLMTVYTAFREIKTGKLTLMSPVKVSANALANPPSRMGFPQGTVLTIDTAVKILMVKSANDIATALAESVSGNEPAFVAAMNANAARLGMKDSHFVNPHGLHDPQQYTSARDLALLTVAIRNEFAAYNGYFRIPAIQVGNRLLRNHNPLLQRFDGTTGMKTGFVCASGLNIVATVKRQGRELVAVVLGGPTGRERNVRAARLLTESFAKRTMFITAKLGSLQPAGPVNRVATDMREQVCSKKAVVTESGEDEPETKAVVASLFGTPAKPEPTLEELEAIYLKPKGSDTRSISIALGNATGPDPFGLLVVVPASENAFSTQAAGQAPPATPWPIAAGTADVKVPVPQRRPTR